MTTLKSRHMIARRCDARYELLHTSFAHELLQANGLLRNLVCEARVHLKIVYKDRVQRKERVCTKFVCISSCAKAFVQKLVRKSSCAKTRVQELVFISSCAKLVLKSSCAKFVCKARVQKLV